MPNKLTANTEVPYKEYDQVQIGAFDFASVMLYAPHTGCADANGKPALYRKGRDPLDTRAWWMESLFPSAGDVAAVQALYPLPVQLERV
jgi:hypothetical protein